MAGADPRAAVTAPSQDQWKELLIRAWDGYCAVTPDHERSFQSFSSVLPKGAVSTEPVAAKRSWKERAEAGMEEQEEARPAAAVTVRNMPGTVLAEFQSSAASVKALRQEIYERTHFKYPPGVQRLVRTGHAEPVKDSDSLVPGEPLEVTLVVDETPLWTWELEKSPNGEVLEMDGPLLKCPKLATDYVNVLTKEPVQGGRHYFQFVMHSIGDEQWVGLVTRQDVAGSRVSGRVLKGYTYYCGRMRHGGNGGNVVDGRGAFHVGKRAVKEFKSLKPKGDVVGMLLDLDDAKAVVFDLNGVVQGACKVKEDRLWLVTHLDRPDDCVELRKLPWTEAPDATKDALAEPLCNSEKGKMTNWMDQSDDEDDGDRDGMRGGGNIPHMTAYQTKLMRGY
uniref:Uncharacterized protein n=1 Tax=Alexandrium catenella TaxID=2925 RepID=A0A7S1KZU9_ALECA|mmetsp:Transcript_103441/g.275175  ORF Transcript_103441/g.275175 Transcript_103441/m.275175 type:complete len:393 (+) Transcript_103441:2-1180(+)